MARITNAYVASKQNPAKSELVEILDEYADAKQKKRDKPRRATAKPEPITPPKYPDESAPEYYMPAMQRLANAIIAQAEHAYKNTATYCADVFSARWISLGKPERLELVANIRREEREFIAGEYAEALAELGDYDIEALRRRLFGQPAPKPRPYAERRAAIVAKYGKR
jgi:hypothetical protein